MLDLILKKGKERSLLRRHPWIYDTAVHRLSGKPSSGETVRVVSADGRVLAWAAYSPASALRARCWSFREDETIDAAWFEKKLRDAVAAREPLRARTSALRLVFGEADSLPGLIVDRYGDYLVTQFQAAGVEAHRDLIADLLMKITGAKGIFDRSDAATRHREGLETRSELLRGEEPPKEIEVVEDGVRYGVDVRIGHKTGFYVDQRESRLAAQKAAEAFKKRTGRGLRALNCFCYTGGFSLALLRGGAAEVVSVDSSQEALDVAAENAARNGFDAAQASFVCADVFDYLRLMRERGEHFDLIILDPPKFASNHRQVDRAARAYKDINLNALRLLQPGGELFTFSCSGAIDVDLFQKIVAGAVFDAGVNAWAVGRFGAGADHPLLMTYPEGEYLKGLHLLVRP
jgi:23S rRNA (cytosine1962-C5)-methyltransferase